MHLDFRDFATTLFALYQMEPVKIYEQPQWMKGILLPSWLAFLVYLLAFILFIVGMSGSKWYISPTQEFEINGIYREPTDPVEFGLFWMCARGHCLYSMQVDYMVVPKIRDTDVQRGYEKYLTPVVIVLVIGLICAILAMVAFLGFLSGFKLVSPFLGFPAGGFSILAGLLSIIACIIFGNKFRGASSTPPFGRSFWLTVVAGCFMIIVGVFMILMAIAGIRKSGQSARPNVPFFRR